MCRSATFNTLGAGSENLPGTTIGLGNYAYFTWPSEIEIFNLGSTVFEIEVAVPSLGTDTNTLNNTASITINTIGAPTLISLESDKALNSFCPTDTGFMTFTASPIAANYVFYNNNVAVVSSTSNVLHSNFCKFNKWYIHKSKGL